MAYNDVSRETSRNRRFEESSRAVEYVSRETFVEIILGFVDIFRRAIGIPSGMQVIGLILSGSLGLMVMDVSRETSGSGGLQKGSFDSIRLFFLRFGATARISSRAKGTKNFLLTARSAHL